ncbi:hypothetical protein C5167_011705 [Papaver somniferum]|uniref:Uncharacterized protein n=1 Tax=Papaver somniferum TaxID=3469 RepID=A0A4Y7K722_PAPSO|nr:hypothetical protein C5167_011705 [Papaver somniferum]
MGSENMTRVRCLVNTPVEKPFFFLRGNNPTSTCLHYAAAIRQAGRTPKKQTAGMQRGVLIWTRRSRCIAHVMPWGR